MTVRTTNSDSLGIRGCLLLGVVVLGASLAPGVAIAQSDATILGDSLDLQQLQDQFRSDEALSTLSSELVDVESRVSKATVRAGASFEVAVVIQIQEGWHINAHEPLQDFLVGTKLNVLPSRDFVVSDLRYPAPHKVRFAFSNDELDVYEGQSTVFLSAHIAQNVVAGPDTLRAFLRIQACNDQVCLKPSTIPVAIPVQVGGNGAEERRDF
jgi:DsbC/DsbD-like thiol-disulfide interchange protein